MREADWTEPMNVWQRYLISALLPFTISSMIIGTLGLIIMTGMVSSKCVFVWFVCASTEDVIHQLKSIVPAGQKIFLIQYGHI
jgi:hypothetical protein